MKWNVFVSAPILDGCVRTARPATPAGRPGRHGYAGLCRSLCVAAIVAGLLPASSAWAAPDAAVIAKVKQATYEVVVLKPTKDPLTYERPLPLDLIPYAIRTDQYYSVGTAFALEGGQLVTAAHVLELGADSQFRPVRVRDQEGHVHDIDQIVKYSNRRDFVVFTLKGETPRGALAVNTRAQVNEQVYAVGNALGEGVVFRDGLYTSNTREDQDGEWEWIRFSAAVSPGNSGGPLLDATGNVIGVVLGKSENENLNYALPVAEVLKASEKTAEVDQKMIYVIDNMDMTLADRLRAAIPLPKPLAALDTTLNREFTTFGEKLQRDYFSKYRDRVFPDGSGSTRLLNSTYDATMPGLIAKADDGTWDAFFPENTRTSDLSHNGFAIYGWLRNYLFVRLRHPDNLPLRDIHQNSKAYLDLLLRAIPMTRQVGMERIKITSMGKATEDYNFTDHYGRRWIVRTWKMPYSNNVLVSFALPVPGGTVSMLRIAPTARAHGYISDLKALADFFYVSYYGTLADWTEFMTFRELLPPVFDTIKIDATYGRQFRFTSKRVGFSYGPDQMSITPNSDLTLQMSYFSENGKIAWDVANVIVGADKEKSTYYSVARRMRPPRELDDAFQSKWQDIVRRRHPYNHAAFNDNKKTIIGDVFANGLAADQLPSASLVYTAVYVGEGSIEQRDAAAKLDHLMQNLRVSEH